MYKIIDLNINQDERGRLVAIEGGQDIPFEIKRVFYIFDVKENAIRAQHANIYNREIILCLSGSCKISLDDGSGQNFNKLMSRNNEAIYIEPMIWVKLYDFSKNCLLLVMADTSYDKNNIVDDYEEFLNRVSQRGS